MPLSKSCFNTNYSAENRPRKTSCSFIVSEFTNPGFSGAISLSYCCFSLIEYNDKLFDDYCIHFPSGLEKAVTKRKAEFFAGRHCAKKSLSLLDGTVADIHIDPQRCPVWPAHTIGSISHSNQYAAAVTALKMDIRGIGIDIQYEIDKDTFDTLKGQIICGQELDLIRNNNDLNSQTLFTIVFSVKESFFKAAFAEVGRYFDFSSISVTQIDQTSQRIFMRINETLSKNLVIGNEVQAEYRITPEKNIMTLVCLY